MSDNIQRKRKRNRRVLGSRHYRDYSIEMLEVAVDLLEKNIISSRQAEKQLGIPRRTILNKAKKMHMKPAGGQKKLTDEEEDKLVNVLIAAGDYGSPMTKLDLKMLVFKYLQKNSRTDIFHGKMPGDAWVEYFLKRHSSKLTLRITQNIKQVRAQKGLKEMENFFDNLQKTLKDVLPTNILNYDETNLADNPGASKCIFRRSIKYPERIVNSTKSCISIMFTASAAGVCLPTYVVYKATNLYSEWVDGGPDKTRYNCTKSGWFDSASFEDYFKTIVLEWAKKVPGPKVVIGDNLSSHLNIEVVELSQKHNIRFVFLPPNSTHLTQPLDVAYFAPLKREWKKILLEYKIRNPGQTTLNKKHFPKLLTELTENVLLRDSNNIKSGFRAAGIWPVNARNVLKRIPEYFDDVEYGIDTALLDYLKETRAPKPMLVKRSKKLSTEPGKSVCAGDILVKTSTSKTTQYNITKRNITTENRLTNCDNTEEIINLDQEYETNISDQKRCETTKKSIKGKPQKTTLEKKINRKVTVKNSRADCDNNIEKEIEIYTYMLDEKTGNFVSKYDDNQSISIGNISNDQLVLQPLSSPIIYNPGSLNILCITVINARLGSSVQDTNVQSSGVCALSKISKSDNENMPFIAMSEIDLPICLQSNIPISQASANLLKVSTNRPSKVMIKSDEKVNIKIKLTATGNEVITQSAHHMKLALPKKKKKDVKQNSALREIDIYNENASTLNEENSKRKRKNATTGKKTNCGKRSKMNLNSREKAKTNKQAVKTKGRNTYYIESSSENSDNLSLADTDNSEYETFSDFITTCLKEQAEKENLEPDIPFGISDINYFTGDVGDLKKGDWIVAKFATKKSLKHYVGRVLYMKNNILTVKYVRKVNNSKGGNGLTFTYPNVEDVCEMKNLDDVILVLPQPNISRRGQVMFDVDLSSYNIQ